MTWPRLGDWAWVVSLPTTNFRIFVTVALEVIYVLTILVMMAFGRDLQVDVIVAVGSFITLWLGIDVKQFSVKRKTHAAPPTSSQEPAQP